MMDEATTTDLETNRRSWERAMRLPPGSMTPMDPDDVPQTLTSSLAQAAVGGLDRSKLSHVDGVATSHAEVLCLPYDDNDPYIP